MALFLVILWAWCVHDGDSTSSTSGAHPAGPPEAPLQRGETVLISPGIEWASAAREGVATELLGAQGESNELVEDREPVENWLYYGAESRIPVPDFVFDEKYGPDLSLAELKVALETVRTQMNDMSMVLGEERYALGYYDARARPPMVAGKPEYPVAVATGDTPILMIRSTPDDPENLHVVWLAFDEYPELYEVRDEWAYLGYRVFKAKKQAGQ